ncbi:hypothetical protein HUT19_21040 [Streptomyces sp. NA02950]|uniref:hypothetical protein n=1 Tax=Streptomyces sp. NA02950 TaxID=2742137 RepID=UPI001591F97A|nr:hypothetical protein [Streptomyces sp. NA02950]QKV93935.1 hypothetical protein HUT19_21040 [Streptomyces sp. NA02950]
MRTATAVACAIGALGVAFLTTGCADGDLAERAQPAGSAHQAANGGGDGSGSGSRTLALGTPTSVTYKRGSDHQRGALEVTAVSVRKGARGDLRKAGTETRTAQPYYVTMRFENTGGHSLHYPFLNAPTGLEDSSGTDDQPLVTESEMAACPGKDPDDFAVGARITLCKVFLVPNGMKPTAVTYSTGDAAGRPVRWKATGTLAADRAGAAETVRG